MKPARNNEAELIEQRAAEWLARRDDALTMTEAAEFARWRAADPRHETAASRLEATWILLQQLGDFRPSARTHPDRDLLAPPRRRWFSPSVLATAAAITLAALGAWLWHTRATPTASEPAPQVYVTTPGGYQRLTLPDGSVVELNSDSEVRVRYTAGERRTELVRGQAHFTVAKNKERPFWVATGLVAVRAVGTAFDVRVGANDVRVLVTAGTVELDRSLAAGNGTARSGRGHEAVMSRSPSTPPGDLGSYDVADRPRLSTGWRAVISSAADATPVIEQVAPDAMRDALAWHGPRLTFIETPLAEVVEQFNRRNDMQIALADPELATMPVGGSFGADNLEAFVRLLCSNGDIVDERPEPGRIVLRKARATSAESQVGTGR